MATRRPAGLAMLVLAAGTSAPAQIPPLPTPTPAIPILQEIVATQAFEERVIQYVTLHRLLEGLLPQLWVTRDMGQLQMSVRGLALRVRTARANAHQGDLIGPDVARVFRRRIATCLPAAEWAAIFADNAAEAEDEEGAPAPPRRCTSTWRGPRRCRSASCPRRCSPRCRGCPRSCSTASSERPGPVGPPRQPDRGLHAGRLRRSHLAATSARSARSPPSDASAASTARDASLPRHATGSGRKFP